MGSKANYTQLLEARAANAKRTEELVTAKLNYLVTVGRAVMKKKLGSGWRQEELSFLGDFEIWFKFGGTIKELTETNLTLVSTDAVSKRPKGAYKIPTAVLRMSDRDFAHYIRERIYGRKEYLRKLELNIAAQSIKDIEAEIAKKAIEVTRLQNMVAGKRDKLARKKAALELEKTS